MKKLDLTGQKFNRLQVITSTNSINGRTAWECLCDCGNIKVVKTDELRSGDTKSCGCFNIEQRSLRAIKMYSVNIKYTPSETTARRIWRANYSEMPFEDFFSISQMNCDYCKATPNNLQNSAKADPKASQYAKDNGDFTYNGLDRFDNSLPHSKENCVACCKWCNYAKRDRTYAEFKAWIIRVYDNLKNRNDSCNINPYM